MSRGLILRGLKAAKNWGLWMVDLEITGPKGKPSAPQPPVPLKLPS